MSTDDDTAKLFGELLKTLRELRARCPWDREQTLATLAPLLVEEAYEVADAIECNDPKQLADELGDVIAQVLAQIVIAEEQKQFQIADLLAAANQKLIQRHPHVYGDVKADTAEVVIRNWNEMKKNEREAQGNASALDGVARAIPALLRAEKLGEHARAAGMDWADVRAVLSKVREELEETEHALDRGDKTAALDEIGDMLLALANAPRFLSQSSEHALRRACIKFVARFKEVERLAASRNLKLTEMDPQQIDQLWREAKRACRAR